ncbi:MAG: 2Fe-2S iron-sulfur cluster-binding protein, partial [Anaerolineae bacterium]|nr:2Fe-2S iron-sulfur cluster-binding protein [Anaerolineae bacterium]
MTCTSAPQHPSTLAPMLSVFFRPTEKRVAVPPGTLLSDAARMAGVDVLMPCGGQGRCGRCAVVVESGSVRRRSTQRLSPDDVAAGYALACRTLVESDVVDFVPPQERIERRIKETK